MLWYVTEYHVTVCYFMLLFITLCYGTLRQLCYGTLRYAILRYNNSRYVRQCWASYFQNVIQYIF